MSFRVPAAPHLCSLLGYSGFLVTVAPDHSALLWPQPLLLSLFSAQCTQSKSLTQDTSIGSNVTLGWAVTVGGSRGGIEEPNNLLMYPQREAAAVTTDFEALAFVGMAARKIQ